MSRGGPALAVLTGETVSGTLSQTLTSLSVAVEMNECVWAVVAGLYTPQLLCNNVPECKLSHSVVTSRMKMSGANRVGQWWVVCIPHNHYVIIFMNFLSPNES